MQIKGENDRVRYRASLFVVMTRYLFLGFLILAGGGLAQPAAAATRLTPSDYIEIYQLYAAYSLALDTGNGAGRVATFTPDGTFKWYMSKHQPETMDMLLKRTNAYPQKKIPDGRMMHIQTTIQITATDSGADGSCYALLPHQNAAGKFLYDSGFYKDTLVKTAAGWRFKIREVWISGQDY